MSMGDRFCLRYDHHSSLLRTTFQELYATQRFVDVTLSCQGDQFHCHRAILSACSSLFSRLLEEKNNPSSQARPIIILSPEIQKWQMVGLIDFMYHGEVTLSFQELPEILKAAELLEIRGLTGISGNRNVHQNTKSIESEPITTEMTDQKFATCEMDSNNNSGEILKPSPQLSQQFSPFSPIISCTIDQNSHVEFDQTSQDIMNSTAFSRNYDKEPPDYHNNQDQFSLSVNNLQKHGCDGISVGNSKRKRTCRAQMQKAAELILRGLGAKKVCDELGMNLVSLRAYMKRKGYLPLNLSRR